MDYEKKYNEAIKRAKQHCADYVVETIFPELKESEDERIRNFISNELACLRATEEKGSDRYKELTNAIAWLEKQGKETSWKPSKEEMDVLYGLAYITNQYDEHKEEVITRLYQDLKREFFNGSSYENMFPNTEDGVRRRSTIQVLEYARSLDAYNQYGKVDIDKNIAWLEKQGEQKPADKVSLDFKKGDILYEQKTMSILLVYERNGSWLMTFCDYWMLQGKLHVEFPYENYGLVQEMSLVPATKEQRDLLFQKIKEAGYEWDADKKELKKIEKKSSWSEEDDEHLERILKELENQRQRPLNSPYLDKIESDYNWLKSLKDRYTWKPSDEQMKALDEVIRNPYLSTAEYNGLIALKEQLKAL